MGDSGPLNSDSFGSLLSEGGASDRSLFGEVPFSKVPSKNSPPSGPLFNVTLVEEVPTVGFNSSDVFGLFGGCDLCGYFCNNGSGILVGYVDGMTPFLEGLCKYEEFEHHSYRYPYFSNK